MRVLVVGKGISGQSAFDYLKRSGTDVDYAKDEWLSENFNFDNETDKLLDGLSFIVVSPGVCLEIPFIQRCKLKKVPVIGEFELGTIKMDSDIIAVTGTNGKTTTVTLINFLLKDFKKRVFLGGNIGVPVTSFCSAAAPGDIAVLECSSYQLETVMGFHAHIAAILNISEDHMSRHKTMENYIRCKQKIVSNQTDKDFLLVCADDEILMQNVPKTAAKVYYFSTKSKVEGCYVKGESIYFNDNLKETKLVSLKGIKLIGEHNISNILCACLAVYLETGSVELLRSIKDFQGVEHRIEYVKNIAGVLFYNDSKATNIASTLVAVRSFKQKINLILGGSDKGYGFDELFENLPKNVKNIAIFGDTKQKIAFSAKKYKFKNIFLCNTLRECVDLLYKISEAGEVILLSPACASFDFFKNFEERGNVFKKIVKEIADNEISCDTSEKKT